jgi:predicted dienelactone hydrolase
MKKRTSTLRLLAVTTGVLVALFASGLGASAKEIAPSTPVELLPPTGQLAIGRTSMHWVDANRPRKSTSDGTPGELMAHFWYPAEPSSAQSSAAYIPGFERIRAAVGEVRLKDEAGPAYDALSSARTHVVADARVGAGRSKFPVLVLVHGLRFHSLGYSMLAEELASHGYVVVGVDLSAIAFAVVFPDNRVTRFDENQWTRRRTPGETRAFEKEQVDLCANDLQFALNQLEMLDSGGIASRFEGRLDLTRIGVIGHSFGGRVAARACQLDARLKAVTILDSFGRVMTVEKNPQGVSLEQPAMLQYARRVPARGVARLWALAQNGGKDLEEELRPVRKEFCESVKAESYEVTLSAAGVVHESFSDLPLLAGGLSREERMGHERTAQTIRDYTRAFFDRHLRLLPAPLLDPAAENPEDVSLTRHSFAGR